MRMIPFLIAGGGGRRVHVNPEQVVCVVEQGEDRTQVITTGLSGASSMSLVVDGALDEVASALQGRAAAARRRGPNLLDLPPTGGSSRP